MQPSSSVTDLSSHGSCRKRVLRNMPGQQRRGMRQWLDEDSRKFRKTFGASAAYCGAGSFFLRQSSERANATGSAATAATTEA